MTVPTVADGKMRLNNEQYGEVTRRLDEIKRRTDEGALPFESVMDALQRIIEGALRVFSVWKSVLVGGKKPSELGTMLETAGYQIGAIAKTMLGHKKFKVSKPVTLDFVRVTVKDLGFSDPNNLPMTTEVWERAKSLGLDPCPSDAAAHLRMAYPAQPMGECLLVAMEQIPGADGDPRVFALVHGSGGRWLSGDWANPTRRWRLDHELVFASRK